MCSSCVLVHLRCPSISNLLHILWSCAPHVSEHFHFFAHPVILFTSGVEAFPFLCTSCASGGCSKCKVRSKTENHHTHLCQIQSYLHVAPQLAKLFQCISVKFGWKKFAEFQTLSESNQGHESEESEVVRTPPKNSFDHKCLHLYSSSFAHFLSCAVPVHLYTSKMPKRSYFCVLPVYLYTLQASKHLRCLSSAQPCSRKRISK